MKIRHFLRLTVCFVVVFCSCASGGGGYFGYRDHAVRGEIRGTLYGVEFCAEITRERDESGAWVLSLCFLSPTSLSGLSLCRVGEEVEVHLGDLEETLSADRVEGLLLPMTLLFESEEDVVAVHRTGELTLLTLPGDMTLTLGADGFPTAVKCPNADFFVVWKER